RAYCLKTQPATGETYPKSDLFNKAVKCIVGGIFWGKSFSINGVINKNIPRSLLFTFQVFARDRRMINFYTGEKI
ncbi:hypothetical protein, partial [Klebsiella pneumoniae]